MDGLVIDVSEYGTIDYPTPPNVSEGPDFIFTCPNEDLDLGLFRTLFQPLVYSMVFLLGLVGNGLLLTVLLQRRGPLRITEIYLLHLALADLLLLLTFPFAVAQALMGWAFGDFLCKAVGVLSRLNLLCGSLLLACIGFDRYLAIVHAIPSLQRRRPRTVHLTCALLWLLCLSLALPNAVFLSVGGGGAEPGQLSCTYNSYGLHASNWLLTNRLLTHLLCFFLPLAAMSYCYTAVAAALRRGRRSPEKQGAIRLALLVTLAFCLCWLPYNVTVLVESLVVLGAVAEQSCHAKTTLTQSLAVTESLGYWHCCLNPVLYAFTGVRFRGDLRRLLAKWGCERACGRVCLPAVRGEGLSRMSVSEGASTTITSNLMRQEESGLTHD